MSPHDGTLDSLVLPDVDTETMSIFLEEVTRRHPNEFIILVLDGAGWHTAKNLRKPANMRLIPLPTSSFEISTLLKTISFLPWQLWNTTRSG